MKSLIYFIIIVIFILLVQKYFEKFCTKTTKVEIRNVPITFYEEQLKTPNIRKQFNIFNDKHASMWLKQQYFDII